MGQSRLYLIGGHGRADSICCVLRGPALPKPNFIIINQIKSSKIVYIEQLCLKFGSIVITAMGP